MKLIELNKKLYLVPETWNELTGRQLLQVIEVLYGGYEGNAAQLKLLKIITGMSWWRFVRASMAEKSEFLYLTHFLVNGSVLTKQLLPVYKGFYGPDDDFNNITGVEFVFSEDAYFKCFTQTTPDEPRIMQEDGLDALVAFLYRKKKRGYDIDLNRDGDPREEFNENISAYNKKKFISKWPASAKLAIFTWYEACRTSMIQGNADIFTGGSGEPAKHGLVSVMRVIAEGGIHGTFEQVQKMYVKMWMVELNEKMEEAKRSEKNNP